MIFDQASAVRQRISRLLAEARRLEALLLGHGRLVRGSLIQRPKFCGKAGCKCTRGEAHPAGLYLSRLEGGVARPRFVRAADRGRVTREAEAYRAFRTALRRWRAIAKELNGLWEELGEAREDSYPLSALSGAESPLRYDRAGSFDKLIPRGGDFE